MRQSRRQYSSHALLLLSVIITVWLQLVVCKRSQSINIASPTPKRSAQRATDIDDGKEHNITIVYDRVNGLSGAPVVAKSGSKSQPSHAHLNKIPNVHKMSLTHSKKLHSQQQKFVPQKVETSRGSKRQLPPPGAMFDVTHPQAEMPASSPMMSQMFSDPAPVGMGPAGAASDFDQDDIDGNEAAPGNEGLVPVGPVENVLGSVPNVLSPVQNVFGGSIQSRPQPISTAEMVQNLPINSLGSPQGLPINIGTGHGIPIDGGTEQTLHNVQTHTSNYVMPPKHVYVQGRVHTQSKIFFGLIFFRMLAAS